MIKISFVDNHACILLSIKNPLGIQKKVSTESDRLPKAAADQNQRTVSCLQDRLRTGGPKQETLPSLDTLQLRLQLRSTTPRYHYYYILLLIIPEDPPTTSTTTTATTTAVTKTVSAFRAENLEKYHFKNQ